MNKEEEKEIREREQKASKGPWDWGSFEGEHYLYGPSNHCEWCKQHSVAVVLYLREEYNENQPNKQDRDFIADCRTDIPKLLQEIDHLREKIKTYESGSRKSNNRVKEPKQTSKGNSKRTKR